MVLSRKSLFEFVWSNFTSSYVDSGLTTFSTLVDNNNTQEEDNEKAPGMLLSWKENGASGCS